MSSMERVQPNGGLSVQVRQDIAEHIHELAEQRQVQVDVLVNDILEQYVTAQGVGSKNAGAAFLLSISGMFNSGVSDTSENVRSIVTDFIKTRDTQ